ncbi:MAG: glycosyltransferase [Paracoccaceae bacterium]|nr:glycosyltransferase [Paracoccaceae bacterium]
MNARKHRLQPRPPRPPLRADAQDAALFDCLERRGLALADLLPGTALPGVRLADRLIAQGCIAPFDLLHAQAEVFDVTVIDPVVDPPDPRLIDALGAAECLTRGLMPWRRSGSVTLVATARPDLFHRHAARLAEVFGTVAMVAAPEDEMTVALVVLRHASLVAKAETSVPADESCRTWPVLWLRNLMGVLAIAGLALLVLTPVVLFQLLTVWAALTLAATTGLKVAAALCARRQPLAPPSVPPALPGRRPVVSILVPLFEETDIAHRLLARLGRLDYPRECLDVLLVVESEDATTRDTLEATPLPPWMRVVIVPPGRVRTKPRALNYALPFCRGTIVGIYDAEDAPAPDQIARVVARFATAPPEVVCLQGVLDFYNARRNWLSRCFTVEYAAWFRVILPGLARLGLAIPLGGTTLFFRRPALEAIGGWDAHNVTEDADIGLRLARRGYRAELIPTVTEEEANCRPIPWVRQRSRWFKGYLMTWSVHMRRPGQTLRQLGARRFIGMQALFLGTLSQFLLAPLLWSFWLLLLGLPHPLAGLPPWEMLGLTALFVLSELVNIVVGMIAVSGPKHRFLIAWVPTLIAYFPLGALAAYKGAWEVLGKPFYWDKTPHGALSPSDEEDLASLC